MTNAPNRQDESPDQQSKSGAAAEPLGPPEDGAGSRAAPEPDPAAEKEAKRRAKDEARKAAHEAKAQAKAEKKAAKEAAAKAKAEAKAAKKAAKGKGAPEREASDDEDELPWDDSATAGPESAVGDMPSPESAPEGELELPLDKPGETAPLSEEPALAWNAVGEAIVEEVDPTAPPADGEEAPLTLDADGAPSDPSEDEAPHARLGLRMGVHQQGGIIARLKARFGLGGEQPAEMTAQHQEEEEALAERIEPDERYKEIETYPIHPPYAHVRILYDDDMKEYIYQVLEPVLTRTEKEILEFIESTLVDTLSVSPEELEDADDLEFITDRFNDVIFDYSIILHEDEAEEVEIKKKLLYYIRRNFIGHGPIDAIMEDPYIEDISCDGPHVPIFLYHRKYESLRSTVIFGEHDVLDSYVIKMAQRAGKHISIAEPILDATMTDGSRLQSTLAKEVSAAGSTFTIRKFRPDPFTPPDLVMFRTMSAEMLAYMWISVQNGASIMYAGGTASGKTTSLNAILLFIPPNMKIVSIEDTREVNLPHENWIAGITRHGFGPRDQFGRQAGEIDMFQLLKNALRQRPEYIIVGEVRGQEAYSLFQAMATGHAAYGTMHADSVDAVIHRLESDPINIPRSLLEALDIVSVQIQTRVDGKRVRRTKQISEIVGLDPHTREILTNEVFRWQPEDDSFKFSGVSYSLEKIQMEKGLPSGAMIKELKRRAEIIHYMIDRKIQNYKEVNKVVSAYYKEPEVLMKLVRGELGPDEIPLGLREIANRGEKGDKADDGNPLSAAALIAGKVSFGDEGTEDAQSAGHTELAETESQAQRLADAAHAPFEEASLEKDQRREQDEEAFAASGDLASPDASSEEEDHAGPEALAAESMDERALESEPKPGEAEQTADEVAPTVHAEPAEDGHTGPAPTEKAHDWDGLDALLESAEAHASEGDDSQEDQEDHDGRAAHPEADDQGTPAREPEPRAPNEVGPQVATDQPQGDALPWSTPNASAPPDSDEAEAWLQEREAEAREAKAAKDQAAEAEDADGEDSAEKKGRRVKRASGGEADQ